MKFPSREGIELSMDHRSLRKVVYGHPNELGVGAGTVNMLITFCEEIFQLEFLPRFLDLHKNHHPCKYQDRQLNRSKTLDDL